MKGYWTIKETSEEWNLSVRRINTLVHGGCIEGAIKCENTWAIPTETKKPKDERIMSGKYIKNKADFIVQ